MDKSLREMTNAQDQTSAFDRKEYSAIAQIYREFAKDGVSSWDMPTAEWLTVFVITEIITTPHTFRSGHGAPSILDAYDGIVYKLVSNYMWALID